MPDLVQIKGPEKVLPLTGQGTHYRILLNNEYGLVATFAVSGIEQGGKDPFVGAYTVVINKMTGQLLWAEATTTKDESIVMDTTVRGKCLHD
jgi:hypothetical protein